MAVVHFITPLVGSFVTILMVAFTLQYLKVYRRCRDDRPTRRMLFFMVVITAMFLIVTAYAYLSSFGVI
jgi:Ca2+/Na+ antiporter